MSRLIQKRTHGFSLIELLITMGMATLFYTVLSTALSTTRDSLDMQHDAAETVEAARFAMRRMVDAAAGTTRLMVPQPNQTRSILAVALDPTLDRNGDGVLDADNDGDGSVDEDTGPDMTNDGASGIVGIDDDGDGSTDTDAATDDDEDGTTGDDSADDTDNDGDGMVDEDHDESVNDDGDAGTDEDWVDVVAFFVDGSGNLTERLPNFNPTDGADYSERVIASNVSAFSVTYLSKGAADRATLIELSLTITPSAGDPVTVTRTVRIGGGTL